MTTPFPPKPVKVWLTPPGPNPWKVVVICEELGLNYVLEVFDFLDIKNPPFINVNPNGRVPAIEDPNTGVTLWESGAIIQYLIEQYDTKKLLTYDTLAERHHLNQWLQFQMSGQGPYFGQLAWFNILHGEKLPSAVERYANEMKRILGVLEGRLRDRQWLVGDRCTYADLAFAPWNDRIDAVLKVERETMFDGFPNVKAWHERMTSRPAWVRSMAIRDKEMEKQQLENNTGRPAGFKSHQEYENSKKG